MKICYEKLIQIFLIQELNREANTISSKNNHAEISQAAVEIKSELEKIREQLINGTIFATFNDHMTAEMYKSFFPQTNLELFSIDSYGVSMS